MSAKLKKLKALRAQIRKIEDTYNYYEKLFLADGVINAEEQAQLEKLKSSTAAILAKIDEQEEKLSWFGKMRNRGSKAKESVQDTLSSDDDIVDHSLVDTDLRANGTNETTTPDNTTVEDTSDDSKTTDTTTANIQEDSSDAKSTYTIVAGDTGMKIARKIGIKFTDLKKLNPTVKWAKLEKGQSLRIPDNLSAETKQYTVVAGDTGMKIAKKLDIKLNQLKALNPDVKWLKLEPGDTLHIPAGVKVPNEAAPEETTTSNNKTISASVGNKGTNNPIDVTTVQNLLKEHGYNIVVDGACGPKTIATIKQFQIAKGKGSDGRVDVGGGTWKALINTSSSGSSEDSSRTPSTGPANKPKWISVAEGELGTKEIVGKKHNPKVLEYHATTGGFKTDEVPWCASFVNWVMKKAGKGGTGSALAMSWAKYGDKIDKPAYGAIGVISYGGGKGHVGFVVGKQGGSLLLLGGNQSNMVKISKYAISKFHAFVVPSGYQVPAEAYAFGEMDGDFGPEGDFSSTR